MPHIDELDWQIIDALQTNPRAPWALIGEVLGVDAATVSRRWQRLRDDGLAWVGAYTTASRSIGLASAIVLVDCAPGTRADVADRIAELPYTLNVSETAGVHDVYANVAAPGPLELGQQLERDIRTLPGVMTAIATPYTDVYTDGSKWRSGALDERQQERLRPSYSEVDVPMIELDYRMLDALLLDGRTSISDLARFCGTSTATIRRRLPLALGSRNIVVRADISRALSDHPWCALIYASVPTDALLDTIEVVAALPSVRAGFTLAGEYNMDIEIWVRKLTDIAEFEHSLGRLGLPITIHDRSVVLRNVKHVNRILAPDGRALRVIPENWRPRAMLRDPFST